MRSCSPHVSATHPSKQDCGEHYDRETVEERYHGHDRALFRRDYGGLFLDLFPYELTLLRQGYLSPEQGWDRITWWLFERS